MNIIDIMNRDIDEATKEAEEFREARRPLPDDGAWFVDVVIGVALFIGVAAVAAVIYKVIH